ncbi:MAG: type II secretion system protein GspD [Kiritimatiellia bacterium]|jgi:general secretion pathway protein D
MNRLSAAFLLLLLAACATAQETAPAPAPRDDPMRPTRHMADVLRGAAGNLDGMSLRALVVGASGDGAALLSTPGDEALVVGAGAVVPQTIAGVRVPLEVEAVTPEGVSFVSPARETPLLLPATLQAAPAPDEAASETILRHAECRDVPMEMLMRMISGQTGLNISTSGKAGKTPVTLSLRNVEADVAVEEACLATGLWFRKESGSGVVRVTTMDEYSESLSSFREEQTETFTLLYPNVIEVASVIYGLYPERVMLSLGEEELLDDEQNDISRRFERFNTIAESGGSSFLEMDPGRTSSSGGSGGGTLSFNDGRVTMVGPVHQTVTLEDARRLAAAERLADTNALGNTLDTIQSRAANIFVTVSRKNSMLMVRSSDTRAMDDIRALVKRLDVPTPMVLLEVKVLELQLDDDFTSTFEFAAYEDADGTTPVADRFAFTDAGGNPRYRTSGGRRDWDDVAAGFPGFNPLLNEPMGDAFSFRLLSRHLQARIQLLEKDGKARTLATPLLLTANNEVSRLFIGEERPMVKNITSQTIASGDTTITVPQTEIEFQAVGTLLLITPNINADRTVTLRLLQENSEIQPNAATIPIYSLGSGGIVQNVPIDVVSSRSVTGTFVAKDRMSIAVGGLIKETEAEQVRRIPLLGRLPLLGWLFRGTETVKRRTELIVMVKPHVISTPGEAGAVSRRTLDDVSAHAARDARPSLNVMKADPFEATPATGEWAGE